MSNFPPPNPPPNDSNPFSQDNPYASPYGAPMGPPSSKQDLINAVKGKVTPPAILLIIVGCVGVALTAFNVVYALVGTPPPIPPDAPEVMKGFQQGQFGPVAAVLQSVFVLLNAFIIYGAIQMLKFKSRTLGLAVSIIAMINIGSCCCVVGLPIGIWGVVVLSSADVIRAFDSP